MSRPGSRGHVKLEPMETAAAAWPQYSPMPIADEGFPVPDRSTLPSLETMFPSVRKSPLRGVKTDGPGSVNPRFSRTAGIKTPQRLELATATQLVERFPQIDVAQRVEPPPWINAPRRRPTQSQDERAAASFDSSNAAKGKAKFGKYDIRSFEQRPETNSAPGKGKKQPKGSRKKIKDRAMLAFACRRADRGKMEAASYFCMGVLHDNMDEYEPAIKCYQNFLAVCRRIGDRVGEALAYNCIGVDFQLRSPDPANPAKSLQMAVHYHTKHLSVTDEQGQFVAHTNLGLAYGALGNFEAASRAHQEALRIAIRLGSAFGQSIAVGNLGMVASRQGDLATAKACLDQHLTLVQSMKDKNAESHACQQLGALANAAGDFAGAARYFEQARQVAKLAGAKGLTKTAAIKLGVAEGNLRLQHFMAEKARQVAARTGTGAGGGRVVTSGRGRGSGAPGGAGSGRDRGGGFGGARRPSGGAGAGAGAGSGDSRR